MSENGSPFEFPCEIPVKIFGRNEEGFRQSVIAIVQSRFPGFTEDDLAERPSGRDNYLSITATVWAESREQIDSLYTELSAHESILMVI